MKVPNEVVHLLTLPKEIYNYQAKKEAGEMQQKQISKILNEESQMPEGHGVSPWDPNHLQLLLSPLVLRLNLISSLYP